MIETIAWALGISSVAFAVGNTISNIYSKKTCEFHNKVINSYTSDIATIKSNIMLLTAYIMKEADREGINLQEKIIDSLMKKDKIN
jgi:hypothetical protein